MRMKTVKRAAALALAFLLIGATAVFADTVPADGDQVEPGNQLLINLGDRAPGEIVTWPVSFSLTCAGFSHADLGQTITVQLSAVTVPLDGAAAATSTTIGPVPAAWPDDGFECADPAETLASNGLSTVTLRMPTTPAESYIFSLMFARLGANGLSGVTAISFQADVVVNTPPTLNLPGPISAEAAGPGGAAVSYSATATDAEDDPDPTPVCAPASGGVFGLGTTSVSCTVTDSGGLSASGSFDVTVLDTTAPVLALPGTITAEATGPGGAAVTYPASASDVVDGPVAVTCTPASGDTFPLGTTLVGCSAADAAGNPTSGSFTVTVVDTTGPTLSGVPANISVTTTSPSGTAVSWTLPTASDAVDPDPSVVCAPASGSTFPVGTTSVTCTATDATGNSASAGFTVTVVLDDEEPPEVDWSVSWGSPIGGTPVGLVTNASRNVPIKAQIFADGVEQTTGTAKLRIDRCDGGTALVIPLTFSSGRWNGHLDTSDIGSGCYVAVAVLNGVDVGSVALDVRGGEAAKNPSKGSAPAKEPKPKK
jgi:hypothetical protein